MPMTEAARLAASERMKAMRANQKTKKEAEQKLQDEMKADPALQEALAVKTNGASEKAAATPCAKTPKPRLKIPGVPASGHNST